MGVAIVIVFIVSARRVTDDTKIEIEIKFFYNMYRVKPAAISAPPSMCH
jgi:hypothetical protein